jgi:hypothetical protein
MPGAQDGLQLLREYSGDTFSAYEFVPNAEEAELRLTNGLVFLIAFWSGPAIVGFKNICAALSTIALPRGFVFRVLDWDVAEQFIEHFQNEGIFIGGNAEALWYKNGTVVAGTSVPTATPARIRAIVDDITRR